MRYLYGLALLFCACSNPSGTTESSPAMVSFTLPDGPLVDDDLTNIMIGTWEAHSLSITMPTHGSSDTTKFLSITPENWREVIGLEPVKTYFLANGRYYAEYYDLNGNLMKRPQGFWSVSGGTLMYEEKEPAPNRFFQEVLHLEKDQFQFSFLMDYDNDGEADDKAVGVSRKLK